jgi:hypothetical protein
MADHGVKATRHLETADPFDTVEDNSHIDAHPCGRLNQSELLIAPKVDMCFLGRDVRVP